MNRDTKKWAALSALSLLTVLMFSSAQPAHAQFRIRKNQSTLTAAEKQLYVDAMIEMKNQPTAGTGLNADFGITNRYDEYVQMHQSANAHHIAQFLPWHRKFICDFEDEVRSLPGPIGNPNKYQNFTLPYWDWTVDGLPAFVGGNGTMANNWVVQGGPFGAVANQWPTFVVGPNSATFKLERRFTNVAGADVANLNSLNTTGAAALPLVLGMGNYGGMADGLEMGVDVDGPGGNDEVGMHDQAHGQVGGQIGDPMSGTDDPAFWMLHSFVDLVWAKWQASAPGRLYEYSGALTEGLIDFGEGDGLDLGFNNTATVGEQMNFLLSCKNNYLYQGQFVIAAPEPTAIGLLALGFVGALPLLRRSRRER